MVNEEDADDVDVEVEVDVSTTKKRANPELVQRRRRLAPILG
jgi:hypothetical protein